jgi:urocanate hydratase
MPSQTQTLRLYTALALHRADWSGQLLLHFGLNDAGRALALASLAAGAAALFLEEDPAQLRQANREGCLTFTVTTLDEALRALKNEVRQGRAITIGLSGNAMQGLQQMVERGILPTALTASQALTESQQAALKTLQQWGAQPLHTSGLVPVNNTSQSIEVDVHAVIAEDTAETLQQRRNHDEALGQHPADAIPSAVQERWLATAPTLFPRSLIRVYWRNS